MTESEAELIWRRVRQLQQLQEELASHRAVLQLRVRELEERVSELEDRDRPSVTVQIQQPALARSLKPRAQQGALAAIAGGLVALIGALATIANACQ